jgi:4-diphosphocytidyl-2-C-methyl-D-erythritol kinase
MKSLACACPAKVNLHLQVLGRRQDGFHEVRTLLVPVGLFDHLRVEEAPAGVLELVVEGAAEVPVEGNTVLRAAQLLQEATGVQRGARLFLRKGIPVAAGLGGGSSDGAAALVLLSRLWGLPVTWQALYPLAAALGSDVPFFLLGGLCWGVGRGEEVYPLPDLPPWWVVLVPGLEPVPTASVYGALRTKGLQLFANGPLYHWLIAGGEMPFSALANDLQEVVLELYPWAKARLQQLQEHKPLLAMVSGSGGTVFALFAREEEAREVEQAAQAVGARAVPVLCRKGSRLLPEKGRMRWKLPR